MKKPVECAKKSVTSETPQRDHTQVPPSIVRTNKDLLLDCLYEFESSTRRMLEDITLSTPEEASSEIKEMWTQSTTTYPHIYDSDLCWNSNRPSSKDLIIHTINLIADRKEAEAKGIADDYEVYVPAFSKSLLDENMDPLTAIAQLYEPDKTNPVALVGYRLPDLIPEHSFDTPVALTKHVEPFPEGNLQILLTPKFWTTDLHIDNNDGLATTIGPTEKIWLTFPPTTKNLKHMKEADTQRSKLARIGKLLEGGLIYKTTSAQAIYVPIGCIHAVFTTHGGFLLSIDFSTPQSAKVLSSLFKSDFHIRKDPYALAELPHQFIECVDRALRENRPLLGVTAWIDTRDYILEWADCSGDRSEVTRNTFWIERRSDWKKKVDKTWKNFLSSPASRDIICPCGEMANGESFREHFRAKHLFTKTAVSGKLKLSKETKNIPKRAKRKRRGSDDTIR
ncbi:uncharacterized protein LY89DRAFT_733134 [Mollisia scopiformis]|uniref:JmjC domain-containing protein n=1 Tax=Mollisia scopiformis TaxID=149040 RepID=A0A194XAU5_MOLSC|nr:uncharacterized protein LY89DRAFT_733134 [Mollisia scopiformis]KUJ17269.1 hypothetical protein LY89DRAFT_733134 [Mollisia scopiformis]